MVTSWRLFVNFDCKLYYQSKLIATSSHQSPHEIFVLILPVDCLDTSISQDSDQLNHIFSPTSIKSAQEPIETSSQEISSVSTGSNHLVATRFIRKCGFNFPRVLCFTLPTKQSGEVASRSELGAVGFLERLLDLLPGRSVNDVDVGNHRTNVELRSRRRLRLVVNQLQRRSVTHM